MPVESRLHYQTIWRLLGFGFVFLILVLSLMPYQFRSTISHIDKIYHGVTYALLMLWFAQTYPNRRHLAVAICLILFGGLVELLQSLTGYRSADWLDELTNSVGVVVGWGLFLTPLGRLVEQLDRAIARLRRLPEM